MFERNTKVTIFSDSEFKHPRRTGFVKRHGVGAWRLAGCSEWYDFNGVRVAVDLTRFSKYAKTTCFARHYQDGDELLISNEDIRQTKLANLISKKNDTERAIARLQNDNIMVERNMIDRISATKEEIFRAEKNVKNVRYYKAILDLNQKNLDDLILKNNEGLVLRRLQSDLDTAIEDIKAFENC